nr:hypothetical protein [uncultured Prevotella sp.]
MNKKEYIQPQIFFVPLQMESLLASLSHPKVTDKTGGDASLEDGKPGTDTAKEHFNDFDSWDSWD